MLVAAFLVAWAHRPRSDERHHPPAWCGEQAGPWCGSLDPADHSLQHGEALRCSPPGARCAPFCLAGRRTGHHAGDLLHGTTERPCQASSQVPMGRTQRQLWPPKSIGPSCSGLLCFVQGDRLVLRGGAQPERQPLLGAVLRAQSPISLVLFNLYLLKVMSICEACFFLFNQYLLKFVYISPWS